MLAEAGVAVRLRLLALSPALLVAQCAPECAPAPDAAPAAVVVEVSPGDCNSYVPLFEKYGLPVSTFKAIAWRESGCNHTSWVVDSDDLGGGLLGINFKTQTLRNGWMDWCGAAPDNTFRYDADLQVRCASEAYQRLGLSPWR